MKMMLKTGPEGLSAQSFDYSEILVFGNTLAEIKREIKKIIRGCVEAFPEMKKEMYSDTGLEFVRV